MPPTAEAPDGKGNYEAVADEESPNEDPGHLTPSEAANFRSQVVLVVLSAIAFFLVVFSLYITSSGDGEAGGGVDYERPILSLDDSESLRAIFPFPKETPEDKVAVCNHVGQTYYFHAAHTGVYHAIHPMGAGGECMHLNMSDLCPNGNCDVTELGEFKSCQYWTCAGQPVQQGINVVAAGVASASCVVLCPKGPAACNQGLTVMISPVNCYATEIFHHTENAEVLPEGLEMHPLLSFPYPQFIQPLSTTFCNYSPERFFFCWGRIAGNHEAHSSGHLTIPPHLQGEMCDQVEIPSDWWRGVISTVSFRSHLFNENKKNVTAGVYVQDSQRGGYASCRVACRAEAGTCETAALVVVSPSKCSHTEIVVSAPPAPSATPEPEPESE